MIGLAMGGELTFPGHCCYAKREVNTPLLSLEKHLLG